ncbi:recombination endonuclease subunit [Serratia phage phiMAM1]|uniref:Recombination endonuclease subunit n=1 Tax=Serratia phage phiMAM1 TaxID=1262513 RepID=K7Z9P2_9CAUD|nr:recombination endonuclease subunit [Serratia phage phiMAM1]AFX93578.1 recombination endonuclease subunit [Serratia phage phiMAM1]
MTSPLKQFLDLVEAPVAAPDVPFAVPQPGAVTHKLTLRRGRAKNFRSVGNEFMEVDYQRNDATLITSDDNGAGKSTMLVWLPIFVLYNDTYSKKEKKAGLVNSMNKKDCVGEIEFFTKGQEWKVRRGIKPDFIEVYQMEDGDWKQIENEAAKADTNKYIETILGIDQKMFENSLVLGKEKYIPFTEMYTADRRLMVETIWDLGIFTEMNNTVKEGIKKLKSDIDYGEAQLQNKQVVVDGKRSQLRQIEESNALIQQNSAEQLDTAKTRMDTLTASLDEHSEGVKRLDVELEQLVANSKTEYERVVAQSDDEVNKIRQEHDAKAEVVRTEFQERIEAARSTKAQAVDRKTAMVDALSVKIDKREELVNRRAGLQSNLDSKLSEISKGEGFRTRFQAEIAIHEQSIQKFHDMGTCPTCTQMVTDDTKAQVAQTYQPQIDEVNEKITKVNAALESMNSAFEGFKQQIADLDVLMAPMSDEINSMKTEIAVVDQEVAGLVRDLTNIERERDVALNTLEQATSAAIDSITRNANDRARAEVAGIEAEISSKKAYRDQKANFVVGIQTDMRDLEVQIKALEAKMLVQPTPTGALEDEIAQLDVDLAELQVNQEALNHDLQDHEHLLYFLRDDQTKARIVSLYLPFLNSKVNEYMESVNMFLNIDIDDKFDISMNAPERKGQSIFSLSTGQRARLNIAIMLALRDVANLKASIQCNILVLDEILENLSERGVQEIVMMLRHKFSGNNLFVISQREQEFQEYFQHNIRYGLRSGLTQVISKE